MPREARRKSASGVYHVLLCGANRQEIFHDDEDRMKFLDVLKKYKRIASFTLYAWCLMGNHVHLLLREGEEKLATTMKRIGVSFATFYNWKYSTTGHLFQDRYHIDTEARVEGLSFCAGNKNVLSVPVGFNTDVNAAALGEAIFGAAKGLDSCLYITARTGIGAGAVVQGKLLLGLSHPEMGHILVRRHPEDHYKCPYHSDCLEGLAAGPAIEERWGTKGVDLVGRAEVWDIEGYYIAQALMQYILILSPKNIILGGGVMNQKQVFPYVYNYLKGFLNDYMSLPELSD